MSSQTLMLAPFHWLHQHDELAAGDHLRTCRILPGESVATYFYKTTSTGSWAQSGRANDTCVLATSEASSPSMLRSTETFLLKERHAPTVRIPFRSTSGSPSCPTGPCQITMRRSTSEVTPTVTLLRYIAGKGILRPQYHRRNVTLVIEARHHRDMVNEPPDQHQLALVFSTPCCFLCFYVASGERWSLDGPMRGVRYVFVPPESTTASVERVSELADVLEQRAVRALREDPNLSRLGCRDRV